MLVGPPLHAQQRLAQPGARGVVLIRCRSKGQLVFKLDAVSPAVVHVDVGQLVAGVRRIVVADPAQVYLPVTVAGRAGIIGDERRPSLTMRQGRAQKQGERKKLMQSCAHSNDPGFSLATKSSGWEGRLLLLYPCGSGPGTRSHGTGRSGV